MVNCPKCSTVFRKEKMRRVKHPTGAILDVCDSCGGMWLDKDEIRLIYAKSKRGKGT